MGVWGSVKLCVLVFLVAHSTLAEVNDANRAVHDVNNLALTVAPGDAVAAALGVFRIVLQYTGTAPEDQDRAMVVLAPLIGGLVNATLALDDGPSGELGQLFVQVGAMAQREEAVPVLQRLANTVTFVADKVATSKAIDQSKLQSIGEKLIGHMQKRQRQAMQAQPRVSSVVPKERAQFANALQPAMLVHLGNTDETSYACAVGSLSFGDGCSISCPSGQYAATCTPGGVDQYYMPTPATATCAECPAGSYDHQPSQTCDGCKTCGAGTYSEAGSTSCTPCAVGTFAPANSASCSDCSAGTYAGSEGSSSCSPCPASQYAAPGSSSCSPCSGTCASGIVLAKCSPGADRTCQCGPGSYGTQVSFAPSLANACTACPTDEYQDEAGQLSCKSCDACPTGQTQAVACTPSLNTKCQCAAGYAGYAGPFEVGTQSCSGCGDNYYQSAEGQQSCKACPTNSVRSGGMDATKCACIAGFTGGGTDNSACTACDVGKYKTTIASDVACTPCGEHQTTLATGSSTSAACVCAEGYYPNNSACTPCPAGFYKNSAGNTACSACPAGSTSAEGAKAMAECTCKPGFHGSAGSCQACDAGKYQDEANKSSCKSCPTGSTTESTGAASRADCECAAGYTGSVTTSTNTCKACDNGTFKTTVGSDECSTCSGNMQSSSTTSQDCVCKPGYTTDACIACESGTFKTTTGTGECTACPANSDSAAGSSAASACKCDPGFAGAITSTSSVCTACVAGSSYQPLAGQHSCLTCSPCGSFATVAEACTSTVDTQCQCRAGYARSDGGTGPYVHGTTTCSACSTNHYSEAGGACRECAACPTGSSVSSACGSSNTHCACDAGYETSVSSFDASDPNPCSKCPIGTAKAASGGGSCVSCSAGTFADVQGLTTCKSCPTHSTHSLVGASDVASCVCTTGYVLEIKDGVASCVDAPTPPSPPSDPGLSAGAVVGIVLGSAALLALIGFGIYMLYKHVQKQKQLEHPSLPNDDANAPGTMQQQQPSAYRNVGPLG